MRILNSYETRYRWYGAFGGEYGKMPWIEIRQGEVIPSLDKIHGVHVSYRNRHKPEESDITIFWITEGTGVCLQLYCPANDSRLMEKYKENPSFGERVVELLTLPNQRDLVDSTYRNYFPKLTIHTGEIPESLRQFVTTVEAWKDFFKNPKISQLRSRHKVYISGESYYIAPITAGALRLGKKAGRNFEDWEDNGEGFDFDPVTEPPTHTDDGIYWEFPKEKILIALPHEVSNERVAVYYSYLDKWKGYMETKRQHEQAMHDSFERVEAARKEEEREQEGELRKKLLSG